MPGRPGSGRIDLVLLDIQLGDRSVPEHNVAALRGRGARVLLYSQETRASVVARCLQAGAFGIVSKSEPLDVVTEAVRCVLRGEPHLNADWAAAIRADTQRQQPTFAPREEEALRNNVVKAGIYPTWVAVLGCAIAVLATVSYLVGCARGRPSGMPNRALAPLCLAMMAAHVVALAVTRRRRAATPGAGGGDRRGRRMRDERRAALRPAAGAGARVRAPAPGPRHRARSRPRLRGDRRAEALWSAHLGHRPDAQRRRHRAGRLRAGVGHHRRAGVARGRRPRRAAAAVARTHARSRRWSRWAPRSPR